MARREAWERADAYRPGKPNWFTKKQKDLVSLHAAIQPEFDRPSLPPPNNATSLLGALLKVLTTGDLALTLCSKVRSGAHVAVRVASASLTAATHDCSACLDRLERAPCLANILTTVPTSHLSRLGADRST